MNPNTNPANPANPAKPAIPKTWTRQNTQSNKTPSTPDNSKNKPTQSNQDNAVINRFKSQQTQHSGNSDDSANNGDSFQTIDQSYHEPIVKIQDFKPASLGKEMDIYTDFVKGDMGLMSGGSKESNDIGDKVRFLFLILGCTE